jgi:hypothetical protein
VYPCCEAKESELGSFSICVDTLFNPASSSGLADAGDAPLLKYFAGADVADIS